MASWVVEVEVARLLRGVEVRTLEGAGRKSRGERPQRGWGCSRSPRSFVLPPIARTLLPSDPGDFRALAEAASANVDLVSVGRWSGCVGDHSMIRVPMRAGLAATEGRLFCSTAASSRFLLGQMRSWIRLGLGTVGASSLHVRRVDRLGAHDADDWEVGQRVHDVELAGHVLPPGPVELEVTGPLAHRGLGAPQGGLLDRCRLLPVLRQVVDDQPTGVGDRPVAVRDVLVGDLHGTGGIMRGLGYGSPRSEISMSKKRKPIQDTLKA